MRTGILFPRGDINVQMFFRKLNERLLVVKQIFFIYFQGQFHVAIIYTLIYNNNFGENKNLYVYFCSYIKINVQRTT